MKRFQVALRDMITKHIASAEVTMREKVSNDFDLFWSGRMKKSKGKKLLMLSLGASFIPASKSWQGKLLNRKVKYFRSFTYT